MVGLPIEGVKAVEIKNMSFGYEGNLVLQDISLEIEMGDFVGIIGPNGGGKTTLLRLVLGLLKPSSGMIRVFGLPPGTAGPTIGYVPQHGDFDRDFPITVEDVVLMGRLRPGSLFMKPSVEDRDAAVRAMEDVSVLDLAKRRFGSLSGGQKQRTLIARALAAHPRMLILDEPTASVDSRMEKDIYELLKRLNSEVTIVLVSHDLGFVSTYVNKVACVNRRLVCHPTEQVSHEMIAEAYNGSIKMIQHQCEL